MITNEDEDRLRALLRAAVPEPPAVDPAPATRARSRRGPAVAVLAAAAAVVAVAALPLVLHDLGPTGRGTAEPARPSARESVNPFFRGACPRSLPAPQDAADALPSLDDVRSVRLCVDPASGYSPPGDAVVGDAVADFAQRLETGPDSALDDRCFTLDYRRSRTSLWVSTRDGGVAVTSDPCTSTAGPADRPFSGDQLVTAYLGALDVQRRRTTYPVSIADRAPLACGERPSQAPVRPEDGVLDDEVVLCNGPAARTVPINDEGRRALAHALRRTPEPGGVTRSNASVPYLLYRTRFDDLVRLEPGPGGLEMLTWQLWYGRGRSTVVPLDVGDITTP